MRSVLLATLLLLPAGIVADPTNGATGFGPLFDRFPLTLTEGTRTELLGPLYSRQNESEASTSVLSPILSWRRDTATDFFEVDFLYPILTYDRFGLDYRVQFLQFFSFAGGHSMEEEGASRLTLFPFYFHQRSEDPTRNYAAVVPFYGHLKNRFFRDEVSFIMLPAYLRTRKRDIITDNYLFPFFHVRRGDQLEGWQFWPLIGHEHKDPTSRTSSDGDVELVGGHDKWFALWPIFFRNDLGIGTTNFQTQRLFLPLYSAQRSPLRDTTSYLWPFGFTYTVDREKKYREWAAPWPFIDFARGEAKNLSRIWPLFSKGRTTNLQSDLFLWPLYKHNRITTEAVDRERTRILLFLYSDVVERNLGTGTEMERTALWPLFTARRDHNGNSRLQLLAPLEPLIPGNTGIERNYSPLWSIWRSERNAKTGAASQSFLWNLYRLDSTPNSRKCSLLFGLIHYQSGPEGARWRLFYIPFGRKSERPLVPPEETSSRGSVDG